MKKTVFQKIKAVFRKLMSAKIIPHMGLNGWRVFFYRLCGYRIGENVFIGMRANIISGKSGVIIGENAVVGACTLVNKDIPDGATAVGIPCRIIKNSQE